MEQRLEAYRFIAPTLSEASVRIRRDLTGILRKNNIYKYIIPPCAKKFNGFASRDGIISVSSE